MKNSKKKSKKSGKNGAKAGLAAFVSKIKITKKNALIIGAVLFAIVVITGTVLGVRAYKKYKEDRTVRVAFYGLSDEMIEMLKAKIPEEEKIILEFDKISDEAFDTSVIKEKYDMLFTWKGEITDSLEASSEEIPQRILESMPRSLRNKKCAPILLDHLELAFSTKVLKETGLEIPSSFSAFIDFLKTAKGKVFSPFFCNGAEDRILIDLVGELILAEGGLTAYNKLIAELRKAESLEEVIDVKLTDKGLTLRSVLDLLDEWPEEGYTHPAWFNGLGNDLLFFAEAGQLGSFYTLLSEHRKIPYNVIKNFESSLFAPDVGAEDYGLVAPALSVMLISDNANCKRYITAYFTEDAQAEFSNLTNLAPVHYQAQAYDRQADDVRFWAASCAGGALPDLYLAVYQRRAEDLKNFCSEIRDYVR